MVIATKAAAAATPKAELATVIRIHPLTHPNPKIAATSTAATVTLKAATAVNPNKHFKYFNNKEQSQRTITKENQYINLYINF